MEGQLIFFPVDQKTTITLINRLAYLPVKPFWVLTTESLPSQTFQRDHLQSSMGISIQYNLYAEDSNF